MRTEEEIKQQNEMNEEEKARIEEELRHPWELLDEEGIDEKTLVPDYYVDRPPTPEFIPNPSGVDKETQIGALELYDFELEAEPVLEVLIGKAIEQGRIEALEDWEKAELLKHKEEYANNREAELLEAQRLESIHERSEEEARRRQLQQEANKQLKIHTQQKILARLITRNALLKAVPNSMQFLEAAGVLKEKKKHDMSTVFIPHLLGISEENIKEEAKEVPLLEEGFGEMILALKTEHRNNIVEEYKRRHNKKEKEANELAEKLLRRKIRAEKRAIRDHTEWITDIRNQIEVQIVSKGIQIEDSTIAKVSELGIENNAPYLYTIGGLLGEILMTVSRIFDVLTEPDPIPEEGADEAPQAEPNPEGESAGAQPNPLELTPELVEKIIRNAIEPFITSESFIDIPLLCPPDFEDILNPDDPKDIIDYDNLVTPGLRYLIRKMERYEFNPDIITKIYSGIIRFKNKKLQELNELLPEVPPIPEEQLNELPEEERPAAKEKVDKENESIAAQNEEIKTKNEEIQRENDFVTQLQNKIRIIESPEMLEYGKTCAIAWIGPIEDLANPNARPEGDGGKRNPKAQLTITKHVLVGNTVNNLKVLILNKGKDVLYYRMSDRYT